MALATQTHRSAYFIARPNRAGRTRSSVVRPAVMRRVQARQAHRIVVAAGFGMLQLATVIAFTLMMLLGLPGALG